MDKKIIVLAGNSWLDIDAYACIVGLYEILNMESKNVYAFIPKSKSVSVTKNLLDLSLDIRLSSDVDNSDLYLVDVSGKEFLENICSYDLGNIKKIYDHHFESYDYWKERLGNDAKIEHIGACASMIVELATQKGVLEKLSTTSRILLGTAILSHTMDFNYTEIITTRDIEAYRNLKNITKELDEKYIESYFVDVSNESIENPEETLINDHKFLEINGKIFSISQLEIWDQKEFISENKEIILQVLKSKKSDYYLYIGVSISDGKTYFITDDEDTKKILKEVLGVDFSESNLGIYENIIIRKEFIKKVIKLN